MEQPKFYPDTVSLSDLDPIHIGVDAADAHPDLLHPPDLYQHYTWSMYLDCKNSLPKGNAPGMDENFNKTIK